MVKSKLGKVIPILFKNKAVKANHELQPILSSMRIELESFSKKLEAVDGEVTTSLHNIIESLIILLARDRKMLRLLQRMHSHGTYLFSHGLATAMMSLLISVKLKLGDEHLLEVVSFGGLLHDVGLLGFSVEQIESHTVFESKKDYRWKDLEKHCHVGVKFLEGAEFIPEEVQFIVQQHHEREDGMGYPNQIPGEVIFYPSKIVSIADAFAALIVDRPHREAFSVQKALQMMSDDVGKFDVNILKVLKQLFESDEKSSSDQNSKVA